MAGAISQEKDFAGAVLDALSSQICVVDKDGVIVAVNRAWRNFACDNGPTSNGTGLGAHYLDVCRSASGPGSEGAGTFAHGLGLVLTGKSEFFQMEYPCHSPTQNRWFLARVTPLEIARGGAVISHGSITDRKVLEFALEKLAATDSLTTLPNRRSFMEAANLEVERVGRFGAGAALVMIDLDDFKAVNDTHGHAVGDEALRCIGQACRKILRKIDILARIGGEEFAVILPGTNEAGARRVAEKLRQAVSETPIESGPIQFNMTASFGVSEILVGDKTVGEGLRRADLALYAAKRAGRNRVMSFAAMPREEQGILRI